jgi:hypothetical protein
MKEDTMMTSRIFPIALLLLTAAGCGNLTAGGVTGDATVVVSGDEPEPAPSPQPASVAAPTHPAGTSHDEPLGDLEATFSAYLVSDAGHQVRLGTRLDAAVAIDGSNEEEVVTERVVVGHYDEIRLVFTDVTANVLSGLPVVGELSVDLGADATVTRPIDVEVVEGGEVFLVVDLNAAAWLVTANPITRTIDEAVFAALVEVGLR